VPTQSECSEYVNFNSDMCFDWSLASQTAIMCVLHGLMYEQMIMFTSEVARKAKCLRFSGGLQGQDEQGKESDSLFQGHDFAPMHLG
jgi:hypothetical protein